MELVTGAMGSLLPKLGELLKEEYGLQKGVRDKIQSLTNELEAAHAALRKIGDVPLDQLDDGQRLWVRDIREASYDMEDIVDAFLVRVDGPKPTDDPHMLRRLRKKVGKLFKKTKTRHKISSLIQDINEKLKEVTARHGRYTVRNIEAKPARAIDPRILNLYKRATELVGIEGPRDELINKLSLGGDVDVSDKKMKVVSVIGFGGLGKTTLVKAVYDKLKPHFKCSASVRVDQNPDMNKAVDDQRKPYFECGAFVPVGRNPEMKKVFRDILIDLDKKTYKNANLKDLHEKQLMDELKEFVKEKRYFIVIDDIWEKESWEFIKCALQESNCESRIVITTRNSEIATYSGEAYKIQPLSRENSEKLLYARIIDGEGKYFDSPSEEACNKILKKCGGVPLAIITIASLLASKPWQDWSDVYNTIGFGHHEDNDDVGNTRRIISFSYYDLSSHLKACLLYLSVYSEDDVIEKNTLIWKWIAEGFIQEEHAAGEGLFELGEMYFNELINRSLIQTVETDEGYVYGCRIHDMVLDFARSLSCKENIVTVLDGDERKQFSNCIARRLAVLHIEEVNSVLASVDVQKVRSLIATLCSFGSLCPRIPVLRVLDMVWCYVEEYCNEGMLDHLGNLLHLRYLGLPHTYVTELPKEVRYLKFLQTLDLWESGIKDLPEEVGLLTQLVCLRVDRRARVRPGLISKLTSLQELWMQPVPIDDDDDDDEEEEEGEDNDGVDVIDGDDEHVVDGQNDVGDNGGGEDNDDGDDHGHDDEIDSGYNEVVTMQFVEELGLLKKLRMLRTSIDITSENMERALLKSLGNLHNIRHLDIEGSLLAKSEVRNEGIISYRHLEYQCLDCFMFSGLPSWIKSSLAPNLSYLDLYMLAIKEQDMETLAKLPELYCLKMRSVENKSVGIKVCTDGVGYFRKLRTLMILGVSTWFDLYGSTRIASTIMPSLETLEFDIHVRSLKDATLLAFDKLLSFEYLGRTSLHTVSVEVNCGEGARTSEVEEVEAALVNAAAVHPKHPTLQTTWLEEEDVLSPYKQACMNVNRTPESVNKVWKLANIVGSENIRALRTPDPAASSSKVVHLLYTNNGMGLLALSSNAVHKLWKWERNDRNPRGKSTTSVAPQLWQPETGIPMTNDITDGNPEEATACNALSKNDSYLISASGGKISLFNMITFKIMTTLLPPPPAATFLAFYPKDNNIIVIGMEDSSIQIYDIRTHKVITALMGHQRKITGLEFSLSMDVLVSSGADAQLCVWSIDSGEKTKSRYIQPPSNASGALVGDTMVQFHYDQTHLLVVHESHFAIYDGKQLECLHLWYPRDALPAPVSSAVYASDGLLIYAGFCDGAIGIFEAESLTLQCRIAPSAYIPSSISSDGGNVVYPMAVAVNPWKPYQIAVGMSDGAVHMLEPLDMDVSRWRSKASSTGQRAPGDISSGGGDSKPDV